MKDDDLTKDQALFERGLKVRREVVGDAYVDAALSSADAFSLPMQEMVTKYCWGDLWSRPGVDKRTRSLMNLTMLAALNRNEELHTHVRGAINNGVTKNEICEAFLHVAIYCGMPAGLTGFRVARQVFNELNI